MRVLLLASLALIPSLALADQPTWLQVVVDEDNGQHTEITLPLEWLEDADLDMNDVEIDATELRAKANDLKKDSRERVVQVRDGDEDVQLFVAKQAPKGKAKEVFVLINDADSEDDVELVVPIKWFTALAALADIELPEADRVDVGKVTGKLGGVGPFTLIDSKGPEGTVQIGTR